MSFTLLEEPSLSPFTVCVSYENSEGIASTEEFTIDISEFKGLRRIGKPPIEKLAEAAEKISETLKLLTRS